MELTVKIFGKIYYDATKISVALKQARKAYKPQERDDSLTCAEFELNMQNKNVKKITGVIKLSTLLLQAL